MNTRESSGWQKLVSVIIPVFNREKWIVEALDSVVRQSYRPIEIVVVDDGSSDQSYSVVESWFTQLDEGLKEGLYLDLSRQRNRGAQAARNKGFRKSHGQFIQFLDSDDILHPEKLSHQVSFLCTHPEIDFVYSSGECFSDDPKPEIVTSSVHVGTARSQKVTGHLGGYPLNTELGVYRRCTLEKLGPWREDLKVWHDGEYNLRLILSEARLAFLPGIYAYFRSHGKGRVSDAFASRDLLHTMQCMVAAVEGSAGGEQRLSAFSSLAAQYFSIALHAAIKGRIEVARESVEQGLNITHNRRRRMKLCMLQLLLHATVPPNVRRRILEAAQGVLMLRRKVKALSRQT